MKREQLEFFNKKDCKILLSNGFFYQGIVKSIELESITFEDRFNGLMIIDLDSIKIISEINGGRK